MVSSNRGYASLASRFSYKRSPEPLHFPVEHNVPESKRHLKLRTLLYQIFEHALSDRACLGSEQVVYWNAANPKKSLAPDVFVRLGSPDVVFDSWKTWKRGTPDLAVEIVSDSDSGEAEFESNLARYRELGIRELVRFEPDAAVGQQLRIWDRIQEDLVERQLDGNRIESRTLGLWWVVLADAELQGQLRLSEDAEGLQLLPTAAEAELRARASAEARIAELEAELRRRGG